MSVSDLISKKIRVSGKDCEVLYCHYSGLRSKRVDGDLIVVKQVDIGVSVDGLLEELTLAESDLRELVS